MRKNKKMMMVLSFCLGAVLFVTTAFAEIATKSGYDQIKDAAKFTAESCAERLNNYTIEGTMVIKGNEKTIFSSNFTQKFDRVKRASENSMATKLLNIEDVSSHSYNDSKQSIWYDNDSDTYTVVEHSYDNAARLFSNPFKEERAKDLEKIFDALVGNLKDYVVVEEKPDGSKELSGSISEAQIPALINAVASFGLKQAVSESIGREQEALIPVVKEDIFVKNVKGKALINKDGIIESIYGSGELSGRDKQGNVHNFSLEVLGKVVDINSTIVSMPDLTGKKVVRHSDVSLEKSSIDKKFIGKYKSDIVTQKDGSYIKIGERILEITDISNGNVEGHYYEQYKPEFSEYDRLDFRFDANMDMKNGSFEYTSLNGQKNKGNIYFDERMGKVHFIINSGGKVHGYDSIFSRVFED